MKQTGDNIVTTIDRVLKAYAPVLGQWMEANTEFDGINTFIGRDAPTAIPADADMRGYGDESFEKASARVLAQIEPELAGIRNDSGLLRKTDTLSVWAYRDSDGICVSACAASMLGTVMAKRTARKHDAAEVYTLHPCWLYVVADGREERKAAALTRQEVASMDRFIENVIDLDAAFNLDARRGAVIRKWLEAFPQALRLQIKKLEGGLVQGAASSRQGYHKILADESFFNEKIRGTELEGQLPVDTYRAEDILSAIGHEDLPSPRVR